MASKKPNLTVKSGFWIDPNHLPEEVRSDLMLELNDSGLDYEQQQALLTHANQIAQMPHTGDVPTAQQCDELKKLVTDVHRLQNCLNALSEATIATLEIHTREAAVLEDPYPFSYAILEKLGDIESDGILSESWDWINALGEAAEYALTQQSPSRQAKPKQARARSVVAELARYFIKMTGKAPPLDAASWFAGFAGRLAEHMQLEVGPRIVRSGIELVTEPQGKV
ncbi:hypothetical protein [Noviluteimonas dokdonensis]|uniref:hypothetical protein n=1 Tax=Noviluteimonas dokdonensis TaxID=414050 RepID=UPI000563ED0E|nr:hypothetical protein [Lysobacter dokdonensis]